MSPLLFGTALALLLFAGGNARADLIDWSYNWSRSPLAVPADVPGTGGITLTDESSHNAKGSSDIVATNIRTFSSATSAAPDHFTNKAYSLFLSLTDTDSGKSANLTFSGVFNGTVSATSANITSTFTGQTTQMVKLGNNTYTVTLGPYAPPGPPTATNAGTISAHVDVNGGSIGNNHNPEPSALILAGVGASFVGFVSWRKRQRVKRGLLNLA
jgi:hypothetical protein